MSTAWDPRADPLVGVVDPEPSETATRLADDPFDDVCAAHDATIVTGALESVLEADPSFLVVAGETTLSAVARACPDVPALPVGSVTGIDAVAPDRLSSALEAILQGRASVDRRDLLEIDVDTGDADTEMDTGVDTTDSERNATVALEPLRALFDVTLVTDEPARISEYGVASRGESVASFRADGVVVATPAGSHGYASAVDAPHLSTAVDAVAVAPIAPFVTQTRRWVLPDDGVALTVERDEGDVALVVDDRSVGTVAVGTRVTVAAAETLSTLVVPENRLETT